MTKPSLLKRASAECIGTAFLLAAIVGSGIVGSALDQGNVAVTLLAHSIAIGATLIVLITMLGPLSGAHFNPAVTFVFWIKQDLSRFEAGVYICAQIIGGFLGVWLTHLSFEQDVLQVSSLARTGYGKFLGEGIATFGLLATILFTLRARPDHVPASVGLYITAAIWFTSSASFANPVVTLTRAFSDTFVGIRLIDVAPFIGAQILGAMLGLLLYKWFYSDKA